MAEQSLWHVLIPQNLEKTIWTGLLKVHGEEFQIHLELPSDKNMQHASVLGDWKLERHLRKHRSTLESRLKSAANPEAFMQELCSLLENILKKKKKAGDTFTGVLSDSVLYQRVVDEIETLGWERVSSNESDLKQLELNCTDSSGTSHTIKIQLNSQYPVAPPVCSTNLPDKFELHWTPKCTLHEILTQFEASLQKYDPFWREMAEIDSNTWILEPEKPGPADVSRRIALGNNSSIQITVDPFHPRMLPQCRFLGADHVINPLRNHLNDNIQSWNSHASLLANLGNILEVDFPAPAVSQQQDFTEECGICYSYRLDSVIPDQVCDNPQCNKPFHQTCLYEWLRSLPSSHQSLAGVGFNTLYGECPYCSKPMSMKKLDKRSH